MCVCILSGGKVERKRIPGVTWPVSLACFVSSKPVKVYGTPGMTPEGVHLACASAGSSAYSRAHNNNKTLIIKIKRGGKEGKSELSHDAMEQVRSPSNCQKAEGKKQKFKKKKKSVWVT